MKYRRFLHLAHLCAKTTHFLRVIRRERLRVPVLQGRRNHGACVPPNFFKGQKVPFFVMKSALFVQASVAINTKLTSKMPFLFGNFDVLKKFRCPFLGALFKNQKCPWNPVPPPPIF